MGRLPKLETDVYKRKDGRYYENYYDENNRRKYVYGSSRKDVKEKIKNLTRAEADGEIMEYKNVSVFQRKDGRWCAAYYDETKNKRCYLYGNSREQVEQKVNEKMVTEQPDSSLEEDITDEPKKDSLYLQTWIYDYFMEFKRNNLKVTTFNSYLGLYRKHILNSEIGMMQITEIDTISLQKFYNQKASEGYSSKTIRHMSVIINETLDYAVRLRMIEFNPNKYTILPKKEKYEASILTKEEVNVLLEQAKKEPLYPIVITCLFTGMRKGEIMALKWENVDFKNKVIHIKGSLCRVEKEADENGVRRTVYEVMEPKTKKSIRSIPMLEQTYEALNIQKQRQEEDKKLYAEIYRDQDFVFAKFDGSYISQRGFMNQYHAFLKKYDVRDIRFHDLRHTFASLLIESGTSAKVVQELLGHTTITTTMDIYTHISEHVKVEALQKIAMEFG